jgi:hypothetical protein
VVALPGSGAGETIGLEASYLHPGEIHVEWQLREIRSTFHRIPPRDDSYSTPVWELPIELFLGTLLTN